MKQILRPAILISLISVIVIAIVFGFSDLRDYLESNWMILIVWLVIPIIIISIIVSAGDSHAPRDNRQQKFWPDLYLIWNIIKMIDNGKMKARQPQPSLSQRRFPMTKTSLLAHHLILWLAQMLVRTNQDFKFLADSSLVRIRILA